MRIEIGKHPTQMQLQECHKCGTETLTIWAICMNCDTNRQDLNIPDPSHLELKTN